MPLTALLAQSTVTEVDVTVTATAGGAGQVVPAYMASSRVTIANTGTFGAIEYKVGSGSWTTLERHGGAYLELNLAETSVSLRKKTSYAPAHSAKLTIEGMALGSVGPTSLAVPATSTAMAVRASQASYGNLIDQGPNANVLTLSSVLFPVAWLANAAVTLNSYRTKPAADGLLYKCTTAGTNGATEPTWNTTIGGTTTSGTAVYTTEKGPYFVDASGVKLFRPLASTQVGAQAAFPLPAAAMPWDMALGDSLILNLRIKYDYAASGQAAAMPILSNRELTGTNRGIRIVATGATFNDLRFNVRDSNGVSLLSDDFSAAYSRKPVDGTERNVCMMIDGVLKMMFVYIDGVAVTQADMFSGASLCPNGMNLATLTGSTQGGALTIGGDPLATTSYECAFKSIDAVPLLRRGLPANIQNVASWYARGGEGLLPQALLV